MAAQDEGHERGARGWVPSLREREFEAGRCDRGDREEEPETPEEALEWAGADGTRSILDMFSVTEEPDFFAVAPLPREELIRLYGTEQPTHEVIGAIHEFYEDTERGQGICIIVYESDEPSKSSSAGTRSIEAGADRLAARLSRSCCMW
jgi:hypothetical protein